jgi:Pyruvate kinase, barrel domain
MMWAQNLVRQSIRKFDRSAILVDRLGGIRRNVVVPLSTSSFGRSSSNTAVPTPTMTTVRDFSIVDYSSANEKARSMKTTFDLIDPTDYDGLALTKIVATIGPTSEQLEPLQKVVKGGMKIMRLNFSHATTEEVELRLKNLALSQVRK